MFIRLPDGTVAQVGVAEGLRLLKQGRVTYVGEAIERATTEPRLEVATIRHQYVTR